MRKCYSKHNYHMQSTLMLVSEENIMQVMSPRCRCF